MAAKLLSEGTKKKRFISGLIRERNALTPMFTSARTTRVKVAKEKLLTANREARNVDVIIAKVSVVITCDLLTD